jgi:hypothetical protein
MSQRNVLMAVIEFNSEYNTSGVVAWFYQLKAAKLTGQKEH